MEVQSKVSLIGWIGVTALAWLGLAGLSDNIVEWQGWFEQGIMHHWRSVKAWIDAVIFWWLPFSVPSWVFDYLVIGGIVARALYIGNLNEATILAPKPTGTNNAFDHSMTLSDFRRRIFLGAIWPVTLPAYSYRLFQYWSKVKKKPHIRVKYAWRYGNWRIGVKVPLSRVVSLGHYKFKRLIFSIVSFVPVLFVCSTILYKFG